jgi:hypothetical protein
VEVTGPTVGASACRDASGEEMPPMVAVVAADRARGFAPGVVEDSRPHDRWAGPPVGSCASESPPRTIFVL